MTEWSPGAEPLESGHGRDEHIAGKPIADEPSAHDHGAHDHGAHDHSAHDHVADDHAADDHAADDPYVLVPGSLPTPFTAVQIRDASPEGTVLIVRTTRPDAPSTYRRRRFLIADAVGTRLEVVAVDEAGEPLEDPRVEEPSWIDLQQHAAMPAESTTRIEETITTALGEHECLRYTRRKAAGATQVYWFARDLPGMPIAFETRVGEQVIERHEVLSWVTGTE